MGATNIWENYDFEGESQKSAYDYLQEHESAFLTATKGILRLQIEAGDGYIDSDPLVLAAFYRLYVVAPHLGNYRRKILTVAEYDPSGRFPVDIVNHFTGEKHQKVQESKFMESIEGILLLPNVQGAIQKLFRQSREIQTLNYKN